MSEIFSNNIITNSIRALLLRIQMFLSLLQNKQIPWPTINEEIDKIKYKGDPSYSNLNEIELTTFNEKISRGLLASNLETLKSLKIRIKDPSGDILNILMDTITKISCQPEELELSLPFFYNEKLPDFKKMDYKSDQYIDSILQAIHYMGPKLISLEIDLSSWSLAMDGINDRKIDKICSIFSLLPNIQCLRLSFFQWGLQNADITGKSVANICESIKKVKLSQLQLDLGRWGCTRHDTLNILDDSHVLILSKFLTGYTQIQHLNLNLRSWGYTNTQITINSFKYLGDGLLQLQNLKSLALNFYMWGYNNQSLQTDGIISFFDIFNYKEHKAFNNLTNIKFIFKGFQYCFYSSLNILFDNATTLPSLLRLSLNIQGWQELQMKISQQSEQRIGNNLLHGGIKGQTLLDCPYLIEFEEVTNQQNNNNIRKYYPIRKKLQNRKNIMKLIQCLKNQSIKQTSSLASFPTKTGSTKEININKFNNQNLTKLFRKEIIFELLEEYLI